MSLVGIGYLVLILADPRNGVAKLAIQYILKDELHVSPEQLAKFTAIVSFAWLCKPVVGILTDHVPLLGTRRSGYLLLASLLSGFLWIALALTPHAYAPMMVVLIAINFALMITQTTVGGMLVEFGQRFEATGRTSSVRTIAEFGGVLVASLVGGYFAQKMIGASFVTSGVSLFFLAIFFKWAFQEEKAIRPEAGVVRAAFQQLAVMMKAPAMWAAVGFWLLVRFSPGLQTALFFHQSNTLKLSPEFIGVLTFAYAAGTIVASLIYLPICRRFPLRKLLYIGISINALGSLLYLQYNSANTALVIETLYGFTTGIAFVPILDLLARATPKGNEALGYALMFSFGNFSLALSDVVGSSMYESFHKNFANMVWLNTGTSALALLAIPFLPALLVNNREGNPNS